MNVRKRNGSIVNWQPEKILNAIKGANNELNNRGATPEQVEKIYQDVLDHIDTLEQKSISVERINDIVEDAIMANGCYEMAKAFIRYRFLHKLIRQSNTTDRSIKELIEGSNEYWNTENSNKNATLVTTQRDYIAGITSTDIARRFLLPEDVVKAHDEGIIHFHDIDYFAESARNNCCLVNLDDMLQNGTVINGIKIEKPHRFLTACTIATQIITAVSSSQYGGVTVSLTHLAPFVRASYEKFLSKYEKLGMNKEDSERLAKYDTQKEVEDGVQTFNYQVNSMSSTNGQAPFISVCMYLGETVEYKDELAMVIEEFLKQRIVGMKNEKGVYITTAFPKLLYFLEEDNINADSKYFYLTELAAKCSAKRLTPDYISAKVMSQTKINANGVGDVYPCMGCRSFLTPDRVKGNPARSLNYQENVGKYYGRFNQGVVTLNLADIAFSSKGDMNKFWKLFEERTELCHKALRCRLERLEKVTSDVAPILWQNGAFARLDKGESIKPLLYGGYSTISLGYAALYECVKYMTGYSHTNEGMEFGLKVMQSLNDKCAEWKAQEDVDYSIYGSPIESTTYKFAKSLKKRFGNDIFEKLDGKDRNYITNSYHVPVFEEITAFDKLAIESKFQKLSPGGAISYVETSDLTRNTEAVLEVIRFIYDNIMYAELNTKSDYCQVCGYDGEIEIKEEKGKLIWECPNCHNRDQKKMNVARRVCGYISTNFFNQGRTDEIRNRYIHIDNHEHNCCE